MLSRVFALVEDYRQTCIPTTTFVDAETQLTKAYQAALHDPDFSNQTVADGIS